MHAARQIQAAAVPGVPGVVPPPDLVPVPGVLLPPGVLQAELLDGGTGPAEDPKGQGREGQKVPHDPRPRRHNRQSWQGPEGRHPARVGSPASPRGVVRAKDLTRAAESSRAASMPPLRTPRPHRYLEFTKTGGSANEQTWEAILFDGGGKRIATLTRPGVPLPFACCGFVLGSAYDIHVSATGYTHSTTDVIKPKNWHCCSFRDLDFRRDISPNGATVVGTVVRSNIAPSRCTRLRTPVRHPPDSLLHDCWGCEDVNVKATFSVAMPEEGPNSATIWFAATIFQYVSSCATFRRD